MAIERSKRETYIVGLLAREGSLAVSDIAKALGVSAVTIRTDLRTLEERGALVRTHGGAEAGAYRAVSERESQRNGEKDRIAEAAANLVLDFDHIMIEAGTTCAQIVGHLGGRKGVQILTNSLLVVRKARSNPDLTVILTGGTFHRASESLVGPVALRGIAEFNVRLAFFGTDGFSVATGLTTGFAEGAEVIRAMQARTEESWLVADSSKYARAGFVVVADLAELTGVITDPDLPAESQNDLNSSGVHVRYV